MSQEHIQVKITQKALIVVDERVLMVLEDGDWELPGGRVDKGETDLTQAVKRELKEELSLEIDPKSIYCTYLFTKPTGEVALAIVYNCDLLSSIESIRLQEGEIDDWKLLSKDELKDLKIYPTSIEAINKWSNRN
jgi:8-oxo-dGTP pyrophosphatase MutT (NUDIX family)